MSRSARVWLFIFAIPVVLVIAGIAVLKVMFTSERLKAIVIPRVEEATGQTLAIHDMSLTVFPSVALTMEGVTMSNRQGAGFSPGPFLTLESLHMTVKLWPLLQSRVEVTSLEVERLRLLLEVNELNQTNYEILTGGGRVRTDPRATAVPGEGPSGFPPSPVRKDSGHSPLATSFLISNLRVTDADINYINHKDNAATRVRHLFLETVVGSEGQSVVLEGSAVTDSLSYGTAETLLFAGLRLRLDHRMIYDVSKDILMVEKGMMTLQDIRLTVAGSVSHLRSNPLFNVKVGSDSVNIADLFSLVPREYLKRVQGVKGTGTAQVHLAVTGTITDSTSVDLAGTITAREASIQYPHLPKPITGITILSGFTRTRTKQDFRIDNLTANLGEAPIRMSVTVVSFDDPFLAMSASGSLNLATVPDYYPLDKGTELSGEMKAEIHLEGKVSAPMSMKASGSMTFLDVSARTAGSAKPVRKLNGIVTLNNEIAETKKLSLMVGESDMTLAFRARNYLSLISTDKKAPRSTASVAIQSNQIFARDIMSDRPAPVAGEQKSPMPHPAPGIAGMSGSEKTSQRNVKSPFLLPAMDMDVSAAIGTLTLERLECTNVRGSMTVRNGRITMQNLTLNAFGGSVVSNGSMDLNRLDRPLFDLSLNLNALEASALLPRFTSFGQRLSGALTMNATLKGALNDTLGLVPEALEGNGRVGVKDGSLKGFKVNQSLANQLSLPDMETIRFKDWTNAFAVQGGRLVVKDLKITAFNAEYLVNGSQGLDGTLDYRMTVYLPDNAAPRLKVSGFGGEAINLFKDQSGRLKLDFNVGGTTDEPKLQLDTEPARKRAEELARQKLDDEKKKLEEKLKDKAGDALRKLFKRDKK